MHHALLLEGKNDLEGRCPFLEGRDLDIPKIKCFPLTFNVLKASLEDFTGKYVTTHPGVLASDRKKMDCDLVLSFDSCVNSRQVICFFKPLFVQWSSTSAQLN